MGVFCISAEHHHHHERETMTSTTTTSTTSTTTSTTRAAGENAITCTGTVAVLPPCLLWAASLAASNDTAKMVICSIDVRRTAEGLIRICATDGHRLLRVTFPQSEHFWISAEQTEPIRLNPAAFSKAPTKKAVHVALDASGVCTFSDRLSQPLGAGVWTAATQANAIGQTYPNVDQLFPDEFRLTCNPAAAIGFNASYVGDFCKIASKLTHNEVGMWHTTDSAVAPLILRASLQLDWLLVEPTGSKWCPVFDHPAVTLDYLLMPVQIRK